MGNDNDEIMAVHQAWIDAEHRGDVEAMLSLCSADIRFFPPGLPARQGKDAAREVLKIPVDSIKDISISNIHVEISGSLAYKTASFITHSERFPESKVTTIKGNHIWVLRRESSKWRIIIVAWSVW